MSNCRLHVQHVHAANHLIYFAEAELGHIFTNLFGHEEEEIDHVLGLACEFLAQLGILRGNADRTGIQVTLAEHNAAHRDQRCSSESEFFCSE